MDIPHANEKYRCTQCEIDFELVQVNLIWKCPFCKSAISIKTIINGSKQTCKRLNPSDLRVGYLVVLINKHIHEILDIRKEDQKFRIALEKYGVLYFDETDFLLVIFGG
jgi:DNA-directed RNA polymerase subunit RPC12/RpoP